MSRFNVPLNELCRTCITKSCDLQNLFEIGEHGESLADKIFACTQILIRKQIDRPSKICNNCSIQLNLAYDFQNLVKNSEKSFQKLLCSAVEINDGNTNLLDVFEMKLEIDQERTFVDETKPAPIPFEFWDINPVNIDEHKIKKRKRVKKKEILIKKRISDKRSKWFECYKCKQQLSSFWKTSVHLKQHDAEEKFKCIVCGIRFILWEDFSRHLCQGSHIKCAYCDETFVATIALLNHLDISHDEKTLFKCEKCAQFLSMSLLKQFHMTQHLIERTDDKKPYMCNVCNKGFGTKISLRNHEEIHSDEKRKQCQFI